ncbi:MAG: lamin tail domain-containing protein [Bacteroidota bacterium]
MDRILVRSKNTNPPVGELVINEFMASNDFIQADQDGEYDDWIELYNNSTESIDLAGYFLSDDDPDLMKWTFPAGTSIAPNGYLIIWADEDEEQAGLHANFKLSRAAEVIILTSPMEEIIDEVSYFNQTTDISYGRFPNGTGNFRTMNPTFNAENNLTTNVEDTELEAAKLSVFPNPAQDYITISTDRQLAIIQLYNLAGQLVFELRPHQSVITLDTQGWTNGMYLIRAITADQEVVTQKVIIGQHNE